MGDAEHAEKIGKKRLGWVLAIAVALTLLGASVANAVSVRVIAGNLVVEFGLISAPKTLPTDRNVPIRISGYGKLGTNNGSTPPAISRLIFEFDKYGRLETRGLPKCSRRKLENTTTRQAKKQCPGAIVGTGVGKGVVDFPDQPPIPAKSPLIVFNGPKVNGNPSVLVHAYLTVPAPTAYIIPAVIKKINKGIYDKRFVANVPKIAGGFGSPTFGRITVYRRWNFKGKKLSYAYARCPKTRRLLPRGEAHFRDGTILRGSMINPCRIRKSRRRGNR